MLVVCCFCKHPVGSGVRRNLQRGAAMAAAIKAEFRAILEKYIMTG